MKKTVQISNLLHKLTKPNGMTLTQSYESTRDLLISMAYHRGSTLVTQREYSYDVLSRPTARNTSRQGNVVNDTFVHNSRSELAIAQVNGEAYGYDYDNVGNRLNSSEGDNTTAYMSNNLNQYTSIQEASEAAFTPQFDADGNQTLIKTETGIWAAVYKAENRPVSFTNEATGTVVTCVYDSMGRRSFKKVTVNGTVTLHQRYLYRGYLQIACCDLTRTAHPCLWLITWDPMHTIATRPLAIQKDGTWYTYGLDLTKNVCEVFGSAGYIATTYTYSPYGAATTSGTITQPIQWSSEVWEPELGFVYYNWRHYNILMGSWIGRDRLNEKDRNSLYQYAINAPIFVIDKRGLEVDFSAIISFTWSWGDSWNSNCVPGWSIDFGLTSAFRNNMIEPIVPVATATVSFMRNIQGTSYATNDWNVDVTFGIGVSVGTGDVSTNIKEPLMHSRDYVKGIPSYELGFPYIFLVHYNSKVDRLDRSDCGYLRRHITTHNRFSVAVPEHLSVMYQNDQSILLPITMDQDWSATLNITYKDVTLNYAQFTGNSDLKNEPDRTGGLYYTQDAYQQSLNWGTFGIILDTKEGKQHLLYDTHIGQDLIHEIIGDRSFTPKKHPGIYFGNTIFTE